MRVVSITLFGFKSFADKTIVNVTGDLNAVVGPNGCGKSNVVEAVLWVLGEQSAKQLRGSKMDDVIFSGSKERRPAQFAEVTISFDNSDRYLPVEYQEVSVTRKLFRTGESEYSINRIPVRLRDIHELFSSTGLSKQSFAIIGQGKVDEFIRQSHQERRALIDEVSGVSKFFQKRREAEKKLEASQHNVERAVDLVTEIESRVNKLKAQVDAANVWTEKKERFDFLELQKKAIHNERLSREYAVIDEQYQHMAEELFSLQRKIAEAERSRAVLSESVKVRENAIQRVSERHHKGEVAKTLYEGEKKRIESAIERISQREKEIESYWKNVRDEQNRRLQEISSIDEQYRHIEEEKKSFSLQIAHAEKEHIAIESQIDILVKKLDEKRVLGADLQTHLNSLSIEEQFLSKRKQEKEQLLNHTKKAIASSEADLQKIRSESTLQRKQEMESLKKEIETKKARIERLGEELLIQERAVKEKDHEVLKISSQYEVCKAQRDAIVNMKDSFYGVHEELKKFLQKIGVFHLKGKKEAPSISISFPVMLLSDFLHEELIHQPQSILSFFDAFHDSTLVVNTYEDAEKLFKLVEKESIKGVCCVVLESCISGKEENTGTQWLISPKSLLISLLDRLQLLSAEEMPSLDMLYVDKDGSGRLHLHPKWYVDALHILRFSPEYERTLKGSHVVGRFSGEKEILSLTQEAERFQHALKEARDELERLRKQVADCSHERISLNEAMRKLDMSLVHATFQMNQAEQKKKELEALVLEKQEIENVLMKELSDMQERSSSLKIEKEKLQKEFSDFQSALAQMDKEIVAAKSSHRTKGSELLSLRGKLNGKNQTLQELEKRKLRLQTLEEEKSVAEERMKAELVVLGKEKTALSKEMEAVLFQLEESLKLLAAIDNELQLLKNEIGSVKKELMDSNKDLHVIEKKRQALDLKLKSAVEERSKRAAIIEISSAEFADALSLFLERYPSQKNQERIAQSIEEIKEWDVSALQSQYASYSQNLVSLKEWLESHREVNFHAEVEFSEASSRLQALQAELTDLEATRESILNLIDDLETKSRLEFMAAYEAIRARFKENFTTLFDGGEADLLLIGADSIMDAGIELKASPPGKEMRSLHLLSGGERCLTALALLFALFQVKKAPLCLLDEVDAPLDEANVVRFHKLLNQATDSTQFILVSHNKRTMAASSQLIGVSMREKGVSCVLQVQLGHQEKEPKGSSLQV